MSSVAKEEKLTAPVILAAIAGILMIIGGTVSLGLIFGYHAMYGGHGMLGMMIRGGWQVLTPLAIPLLVGSSLSSMVAGSIILYCSYKMRTFPQELRTYGIVILIVSAYGIFSASGFWLGSILGITAGIMTISRK